MKNAWSFLLLVCLSVPALAQEEPPPEAAEPEAEVVPAESGEPPVEPAPAPVAEEAAPIEEEPAAVAEDDPWHVYAGLDLAMTTFTASDIGGFPAGHFDSGMYRLRAGSRVLEVIGLELHYGFDAGGEGPGEVATDDYLALFAVPTATVLETVELGFPVGYAMSSVSSTGASADLKSLAYGVSAELPLRIFGETWPDLRFIAGWMVYYRENDAQLYGANLGLRYDFGTGGFNVGGFFSRLWPFGDDEDAPAL